MPIYEYTCKTCKNVIEIMQKFSDPPLTVCPHCGGEVHKLISKSSFHLKGSGWYASDYKQKKDEKKTADPNKANEKKVESKAAGDGGNGCQSNPVSCAKEGGPCAREV